MDYENKLKRLLLMCIKKGLTMHINTKCETILVYGFDENNESTFNYVSYYTGKLSYINHENTVLIDDLIEKVKKYKP